MSKEVKVPLPQAFGLAVSWSVGSSALELVSVPGARSVPVVYDNGTDLVVAAAPDDLAPEAIRPTLEELTRNVHGSGRTSDDGRVHVRLRRLEPAGEGASRPVVLGEGLLELATGAVTLQP